MYEAQYSAANNARAMPLEPQTQRFIDDLARADAPPIYKLSPIDARGVLRGAQAGTTGPDADIDDRVIHGGHLGDVSIRIVRPQGVADRLPAVLYIHGGGWVLGDQDTHDRLIRELANGARAALVFVNYTPSPEARFPTAIEQAYTVARWITRYGHEANLDGTRLAVAGDSVGGNMSAALTLLAKRRGDVHFKFQLLFYPVTDAAFDTASYREFQDGPWLTKPAMEWFWNQYVRSPDDRANILASPLRASLEHLSGLPEALVITNENDVLRDEGEAYARKLAEAGVTVTATRYLGTIHDFVMLNALARTPAAKAAIRQACDALNAALK